MFCKCPRSSGALAAPVTIGQRVTLHNPQNWAERKGRVTRIGQSHAARSEVGIEFVEAAPNFWFIEPSSEYVRE